MTYLIMRDGREIDTRTAMNHSIRLLWKEVEGDSFHSYDHRLTHFGDGKDGKEYSIDYSGERVVLVMERGWELAITEVCCSVPWGAVCVEYQDKPFAQVSGEKIELFRPWVFREGLPARFSYNAAPRSIWKGKDGAPRSAMIVLKRDLDPNAMAMTEPETILHAIIRRHPKLRPSTKHVYALDLDRWVSFAGADPNAWTRYRAQEFYEQLLATMQPQSANRIMASLSTAASWWAKLEGKPELDFTGIPLAAGKEKQARKALLPEVAEKLLRSCIGIRPADIRDFALLVVGFETGMRAMSLHGLLIENINDSAGYRAAHVPLKGRDGLYPVPLSETAWLALAPWLAWLKKQRITTGMVLRDVSTRVEPGERWGGISIKTLYNTVQRRGVAVGIADLHPHLLRHSMITWRLAAGVAPHIISVITGHRLKDDLGILYEYMDKTKFVEAACATTPPWLATLVKEHG